MRRAASLPALALSLAMPALAQVPFEQASRDLASADAGARYRAVRMLKDAAYPEAAVPLAPLVRTPRRTCTSTLPSRSRATSSVGRA